MRPLSDGTRRDCGVRRPSILVTRPVERGIRTLETVQEEPHPQIEAPEQKKRGLRRLRARESLRNLAKLMRGGTLEDEEIVMEDHAYSNQVGPTVHQANIGRRRVKKQEGERDEEMTSIPGLHHPSRC